MPHKTPSEVSYSSPEQKVHQLAAVSALLKIKKMKARYPPTQLSVFDIAEKVLAEIKGRTTSSSGAG